MKKVLIVLILFLSLHCFSSCQKKVNYDNFTFTLLYNEHIENFDLINFDAEYCDYYDLKNSIVLTTHNLAKKNQQSYSKTVKRLKNNDISSQGKIFQLEKKLNIHNLNLKLKEEGYRFPTLLEFISFSKTFNFDFDKVYAPISETICQTVEYYDSGEIIVNYYKYFFVGVKHFKVDTEKSNYDYIYVIGLKPYNDYYFSPNQPLLVIKK